MNEKYNQFNLDSISKSIKLELISVNIEKYFAYNNTNNINLEKVLQIFNSSVRVDIMEEVKKLLNNNEKYYAICGPFGIGKSFTSLILQKLLYSDGIKTLYVNLSNQEEISNLKMTLIKESYFLKLEEDNYIHLASEIIKHDSDNLNLHKRSLLRKHWLHICIFLLCHLNFLWNI